MEPANQHALAPFLARVKERHPQKSIWVYTGDLYEDITNPKSSRHTSATDALLSCVDVLVDGPFQEEKKDITLRFRGSSNQRIIDMNATRKNGSLALWVDKPVYSTHSFE